LVPAMLLAIGLKRSANRFLLVGSYRLKNIGFAFLLLEILLVFDFSFLLVFEVFGFRLRGGGGFWWPTTFFRGRFGFRRPAAFFRSFRFGFRVVLAIARVWCYPTHF